MRALLLLINPRPHQTMDELSLSWTGMIDHILLLFLSLYLFWFTFFLLSLILSMGNLINLYGAPKGTHPVMGKQYKIRGCDILSFIFLHFGSPSQRLCAPPRNVVSLYFCIYSLIFKKYWKLSTNRLLFLLPAKVLSAKFIQIPNFCKIFWRMLITKLFWFYWLPLYEQKKIQWKSIGTKTVRLSSFFRITFPFPRRKKVIQVWNDMSVSKGWQTFHSFHFICSHQL